MVWINALVLSGGGEIIENAEAGRDATPALASPAGLKAAEIIGNLARSSAAAPDLSNAQEENARSIFQTDQGGFMLNWPYVSLPPARPPRRARWTSRWSTTSVGRATRGCSRTRPSAPPLGGSTWRSAPTPSITRTWPPLIECVTSLPKATQYMLDEGDPSPYARVLRRPRASARSIPNADLIRESINEGGPRPLTPFYVDVAGCDHPDLAPAGVCQRRNPGRGPTQFMADVLAGRRLL